MKRIGITVLGFLILFVCWLYKQERDTAPIVVRNVYKDTSGWGNG